jgi:hypothetical protein
MRGERHPTLKPSAQELARGYSRFFEPDVFVEAQKGLAQSAGVEAREIWPKRAGRPEVSRG